MDQVTFDFTVEGMTSDQAEELLDAITDEYVLDAQRMTQTGSGIRFRFEAAVTEEEADHIMSVVRDRALELDLTLAGGFALDMEAGDGQENQDAE